VRHSPHHEPVRDLALSGALKLNSIEERGKSGEHFRTLPFSYESKFIRYRNSSNSDCPSQIGGAPARPYLTSATLARFRWIALYSAGIAAYNFAARYL
jgi:hypothetical protein